MELTLFLITFLWSLKMSSSIRCYSCEVEHTKAFNHAGRAVHSAPTCDHFNGSDVSITDCPGSTMCVKRVTSQDIGPEHIVVNAAFSVSAAKELQNAAFRFDRRGLTACGVHYLSSKSVRRGCAPQTTSGMQEKVGRKWKPLNKIYEVYEEGCIDDPSNEHKLTKTVLCYCRGDLCNASGKLSIILVTLLIPLGILLV